MKLVTESLLQTISDSLSDPYHPDAFIASLERVFSAHPNPQKSISQFERILAAALSKVLFLRLLAADEHHVNLLATIILKSDYYVDNLVRDPHLYSWLTGTKILSAPLTMDRLKKDADRAFYGSDQPDLRIRLLKQYQRKYLVAIGVRDLLGIDQVKETTSWLSGLADLILERVAILINEELFKSHPVPEFAVFALGKHGGSELNYSSDIDLMAVCGSMEMVEWKGSTIPLPDLLARWVQRFVEVLSKQDADGSFYRVDFRLRPDGEFGPLVPTVTGAVDYYFSRGRLWERQMLLKIRPLFGTPSVIDSFLSGIRGFIFNPLRPVLGIEHLHQSLKAVHENQQFNERNIKTAPGGIRSIEFLCQTIQLEIGHREPDLWSGNTLEVLDRFEEKQFLKPEDLAILRNCYQFFRRIEHHLQFYQNLQTHEIPKPGPEFDAFAKRFSTDPPTETAARIEQARQQVTEIVNYYFPAPKMVIRPDHPVLNLFLKTGEVSKTCQQKIIQFPYLQTEESAKVIERLFKQFPNPGSLADLWLSDPSYLEDILRLADQAPLLIPRAVSAPELWELLVAKPEAESLKSRDLHVYQAYLEIRSTIRYLSGKISTAGYGEELAGMMDSVLQTGFNQGENILLIALGKLGSGEPSPGSDADLVALSTEPVDPIRLANFQESIRSFSAYTAKGTHFQIDFRLRPEGKSAPVLPQLSSAADYFRTRADYWEFQTWLRARLISGPQELYRQLMETVHGSFLLRKEEFAGRNEKLRHLRLSQIRQDPSSANLKKDPGGLLDIESTIQHLALKLCPESLLNSGLALPDLAQTLPDETDIRSLVTSWELLRKFEIEQKLLDNFRSGVFRHQQFPKSKVYLRFEDLKGSLIQSKEHIENLLRNHP